MRYLLLQLLLICSFSVMNILAQNDTDRPAEKKREAHKQDISLFGRDDILNISLSFDLGSFLKRAPGSNSFDAEMIISPDEKESIKKPARVSYRGLLRNVLCSFPPIEISLDKPLYSDSSKIRKLKLVTHCESGTTRDEYVIREYLVYKLYNALTDTSFKVRLLKVNYIDSKKIKKTIVSYGIFIEPVELLANRTNCVLLKTMTLKQSHIVPDIMDRVAIFNYMVGNWDWSVPKLHNLKILKPLDFPLGIAVPFDFDLTGVVNAGYAIPPAGIGIENSRERIYLGPCRTKDVYTEDLREFLAGKEKFYSVINDCPELDKRAKIDITLYLDEFFDQLKKPRSMEMLIEKFLTTCNK